MTTLFAIVINGCLSLFDRKVISHMANFSTNIFVTSPRVYSISMLLTATNSLIIFVALFVF